jgi:hypothetical protein
MQIYVYDMYWLSLGGGCRHGMDFVYDGTISSRLKRLIMEYRIA